MKKVFTSILLLAALSVPAYLSASAWLEGDGGQQEQGGGGENPEPSATIQPGYYLIKNVGTGQYLTKGNDWGTRASITDNANAALAVELIAVGEDFMIRTGVGNDAYGLENLSGGTVYADQSRGKQSTWKFVPVTTDDGVVYNIVSVENHGGGADAILTASSENTIVGPGEDGTSPYAQWTLVSLSNSSEIIESLSSATKDNPVDATGLIVDANFSYSALSGFWTVEANNKNLCGGDASNPCAESWQSAFTVSQELTVPNGIYALSAQATLTDYTEAYDGTDYPVVFANEETLPFYSMEEEDRKTNMTQLSGSFSAGKYVVGPILVEVTDGVLTVGVKGTRTNTWCIWDNFQLTYYGSEASMDEVRFASYYDKAVATIKSGETYLIYTEVEGTNYYLDATGHLTEAANAATFEINKVEVANTLYPAGWNLGVKFTNPDLTNGSTGDIVNEGHIRNGDNDRNDWERQVFFMNEDGKFAVRSTNANSANWGANTYWDVFATEDLPEAGYSLEPSFVWQFAGHADATNLIELAEKLEEQIAATETYDDPNEVGASIVAQIEPIKTAFYTSKQEVDAAIEDLAELAKTFFNGITAKSPIDVTDWYIVNPAPMNKNGWEGTNFGGSSDGVCEYWNVSPAEFHQAINLPAGIYKLTAIALTRTGMDGKIYAGDNSVNIATVESGTVNSRAQAANWFAAGNGVNEVFFQMEDAGEITIGLIADETSGDHWTVWKNFKLEMIADIPVDVVYNLVYGEDIIASETVTQLPGDEVKVPGAFASAMHGLFDLAADAETITKETTAVNVTATWAGPFKFSTDINNAKWYNLDIRGGWKVSKCETEPYTMKQDATDEELASPEYQWAFLPVAGDPLKVIVVNKAAEGQSLTPVDIDRHAVVLRDGNYAWDIYANADGFVLHEVGTENGWVNQAGGASATSPLAFWDNAAGKTDGGSTFRVSEVPFVILDNMPLTKDMFKNWIGFDATAEPTETTPYWDAAELGAEHSAGNTIYGSGNVANTDFADVTGAEALRIEGTAGIQLRVLINRQEDNSLIEINPVIGEDGYVDVDLTSYEYVHINAIKLGWSSPAGSVTALILNPTAAEPAGTTYAGIFEQTLIGPADAGVMGTTTTDQTVTIEEAGEGLVNITFSGFALPMAPLGSFDEFTVENVAVMDYEGNTVYLAEGFRVPISGGQMPIYYNGTLIGAQETAESTPVIKLILQNATTDVCYFGANEEDINRFKAQEPKEALKTYDLTANDVEVSDWSTITIADATIISEAATLLGAQPSELIYQLVDTTGVRKDYNGNEGEVLFWVDYNGNKSNWGVNNKYYISYDAETPAITVTQFGAEYSKTLNAVVRLENADGDFVEFKINVTMEDVPVINPEIVKTIEIEGFDLAETAYNADENHLPTFDVAEVCTALGIDNISNAETYIVNVTTGEFVKNTTDGWRNADGDATAWGQATNGYCLKLNDPASGQFDYSGAHDANFAAGDTYLAQWAIVAGEKAVLLKVSIKFLSQDDYSKATGINGIAADVENGKVFNIAGQKTGRVQKGVNIIGGKKVYVK